MKKYEVIITETLTKSVIIEASDYSDAIKKVKKKYFDEEIVLSADDYYDTEFNCVKSHV